MNTHREPGTIKVNSAYISSATSLQISEVELIPFYQYRSPRVFHGSQQVPQSVDSTESCSLVWFGFWFFETVLSVVLAVLELKSVDQAGLELDSEICLYLCLLSAEVKGMHHHCPAYSFFLNNVLVVQN